MKFADWKRTIKARGLRNAPRSAVFLAAMLVIALPPAFAGGPGSVGMQVLKTDMSPRAAGMGGAFVAVADDVYSMNYNPAGLARLYNPEVSAMYLAGFDDSTLSHFAFGMPLPFLGMAGLEKSGFGMSLMLSDAGKFDYNGILPDGSVVSKSYAAQKDLALAFGYGEKVYSDDRNAVDQYLGANIKYIRSTLLEDDTPPSAVAVDAGWLLTKSDIGVSVGASLANFGSGLKYGSEITKLPSTIRLGAAYQHTTVRDQAILLSLEGDSYVNEAQKSLRFGLEYQFQSIFKLRLGYRGVEDNKGFTMGFGLNYGDLALDMSLGLANAVYNASQVALSYKFSGVTAAKYTKTNSYRDPEPRKAAPSRSKYQTPRSSHKPAGGQENKKDADFLLLY